MSLIISPKKLSGSLTIQISKSEAHRALIASTIANVTGKITNKTENEESILKPWSNNVGIDIEVTKKALSHFCNFSEENGELKVVKKHTISNDIIIDAKESGTSLRLLIPVISALKMNAVYKCSDRLIKRPLNIYEEIWKKQNLGFKVEKDSIYIEGNLKNGDFKVRGDISSQFISGLLFALPILDGDSNIIIEGNIESKPYILMTLKTLKSAGIEVLWENNGKKEDIINIKGRQTYKPSIFNIESDWSHAAFFVAAGALGEKIKLYGLNSDSLQGDKEIINIVKNMGAKVEYEKDNSVTIYNDKRLKAANIDIANIPDLAPILAVLASYAEGKTTLYNAKRLKYKESDRIYDLKDSLTKIGAKIEAKDDTITIEGVEYLEGGHTTSHNDHRLAMAISIASIISKKDIILEGENAVNKSSTNFFEQFREIGGIITRA